MERKVKVREHYRSLPGEGGTGNSSSSEDGSSMLFIGMIFLFTIAVIVLGWIWDLLVWAWNKLTLCWTYCTEHWIIATIAVVLICFLIGTTDDDK